MFSAAEVRANDASCSSFRDRLKLQAHTEYIQNSVKQQINEVVVVTVEINCGARELFGGRKVQMALWMIPTRRMRGR